MRLESTQTAVSCDQCARFNRIRNKKHTQKIAPRNSELRQKVVFSISTARCLASWWVLFRGIQPRHRSFNEWPRGGSVLVGYYRELRRSDSLVIFTSDENKFHLKNAGLKRLCLKLDVVKKKKKKPSRVK